MRALTVESARWLTHDEAQQALAALAERDLGERATLALLSELRERYTDDQAAALLDQARLRHRATAKFGERARGMLFVEEALEQASGQRIARWRAARYARFGDVADLGCGIGGDALALAERVPALLALDLDPVRLLFAEHNLRVAGQGADARFEQADWSDYRFPPSVEAAFADPARRVAGQRVFSLRSIEPPLDAILTVQRRLLNLGVKVMPGVADEELPEGCEVEWISEGGTLKEAVLWFGALRPGAARSATVLSRGGEAHTLSSDAPAPPVEVTPPRAFLWEPDPAILRATLVTALAQMIGATQVDEQIAYLTGDTLPLPRLPAPGPCWKMPPST